MATSRSSSTANQTEINTCYVVKITPDAVMPKYKSKNSYALSLISSSAREISPKNSVKIHLGYKIRTPIGMYGSIVNTPILAMNGITVINFCLERDFEEEVVITLTNMSDNETYFIKAGDIVGQIIFKQILRKPKLKQVANFPDLRDISITSSSANITTFYL